MATSRILPVLVVVLCLSTSGPARACKPSFSTVVVFKEGSADLETDQIVLLASRLSHFRGIYPHLNEAQIEGVARDTAPDAQQLAHRRAVEVARAVRTLFEGVTLHVFSNTYSSRWSNHEGNYAAVEVMPPMTDIPDCTPVPIPGFKY